MIGIQHCEEFAEDVEYYGCISMVGKVRQSKKECIILLIDLNRLLHWSPFMYVQTTSEGVCSIMSCIKDKISTIGWNMFLLQALWSLSFEKEIGQTFFFY